MRRFIESLKNYMASLVDPVCWIMDQEAKSILDIGCGPGLSMKKIKARMLVKYTVGVDLFKPYLKICRSQNIHDKYLCIDVRKLPFKKKSFDVVVALQVLEHLPKKDAWKVLRTLEKIACKQVIVSTPIGEYFHPVLDGNKLQTHQSYFFPEELEKMGYKTIKAGIKGFADDNGVINKFKSNFIRMNIYGINLLIDALTLLVQPMANHYFVAYKKISS